MAQLTEQLWIQLGDVIVDVLLIIMRQRRSQLLVGMIFSETHFTYLQKHVLIDNQASAFGHKHVS